ncbi:MAG: starch-binding protein, partial [Paludibacteraceae bacterium]|nr:starch-binding protein [Paludibacteraceae bacterium]
IKVKSDGTTDPGTAVASFKVDPDAKVVKYLNINNWDVVYIHMWGGTKEGTQWHGLPMEKTGEQKFGYDVYSISIKEGDYKNCIFNNNDSQQSADLVFGKDDAQYEPDYTKLVYGFDKWYASIEDIPEPEYITLVYVNKAGWSNVNIQMKGGSSSMNWPGVAMTKSDDKKFGVDVYTYTFMKGQYTNYIINRGDGGGQIEKNIEEGKYVHYNGVRYATLDAIPLPSLAGDFNEWSADANTFELSEEGVGSTTITLEANAKPEFMVIDGQMLGNTGTMTHDNCTNWTMSYQDGGGNNCKIQARNKGEFTFTYDVKTSKLSVTYPEFNDKIDMIVTNAEGETVVEMTKNPSAEKEYYKYGLFLRTGDVVTFYDHYSLKAFKPKAIDTGASISNVATITDNGLEITQSINTNFYLILEAGNDKVQLQHGYKVLDEIAPNAFLSELQGQTVDLHIYRPLDTQSYSTLCLPFALDASQLEYYFPNAQIAKLTSAEVEKRGVKYITTLNFTKVSAIEAGMPYIILPSEDITEIQKFEGVTVTVTEGQTQVGEIVDAVGILKPTTLYKDAYNYLFLGADNKLFYPNVTGNLKGMRSYFYVKDDAPASLLMGATPKQLKAFPALMSIGEPETEEGLTTETDDESENIVNKPYKIYNENNEVIIIFEEGKRNLAGQQVD